MITAQGRMSSSSATTSAGARPPLRSAFTLIEMLTTVAVLIILLGVMVSLARHVRERSASQLTRDVLTRLTEGLDRYADRQPAHALPTALPLVAAPSTRPVTTMPIPGEAMLQTNAAINNQQLIRALQQMRDSSTQRSLADEFLTDLPPACYDRRRGVLRDAWGTPIVFMPPNALNVGIAPQDRPFFFSAGPDRQFSTKDDNLYSYEIATRTADIRQASRAGHHE